MAEKLPPPPYHAALIEPTDQMGLVRTPWVEWFRQAFVRMGGSTALTNLELAAKFPVTAADISASVAGNGLSGGAGSALAVNVDGSTIAITADTLGVPNSGIPFVKLLSTDWTNSQTASGYQKLPSGVYLQWGVTSSLSTGTTTSISYPVSFPAATIQVVVGVTANSGVATTATGHWGTGGYTASKFDLYNRTNQPYVFNWLAVGN